MREGIEVGLELRFGEEGRQLVSEIAQIEDVEVLRAIKDSLKTAATLAELRATYQSPSDP